MDTNGMKSSSKIQFFTVIATTTPDDLKRQYKHLCKKHHPDRGGSNDIQAQINAEYKMALLQLSEQTGDKDTADQLLRMIEQHLRNMYADLKTPLIKKYVPEQYHGLAMEIAKLMEGVIR